MKIIEVVALFVVTVTSTTFVRGSVPIVVATPQRLQAAMKLVTDAQNLLENGDVAGAKRNVDAVLHRDPTFWPALYVRAQIFASQGKYDVALACFLPARDIFEEVGSPERVVTERCIEELHEKVGEEQFAVLLAAVEPQAQQVVAHAFEKG